MKNNSQSPRFYFVRHGQTDWNVQGIVQGQTDIPLNDQGRQEATRLKEHFCDIHFTACFSSDLQRAHETASIIINGRLLDVIKDSNLRERHVGIFEGKARQEYILATPDKLATVETREALMQRITTFLNSLARTEHRGNVLIVAHGELMRNMLAYKLNLPETLAPEIVIKNTAYYRASFSDNAWVVERYENIVLPENEDFF